MALRISLILGVVIFVSMVYAALAMMVAMMPGKFISEVTPASFGLDYERVTLDTEDGLELTGWFVPQPKSRAVIVVGHGYPYDKGNMLPVTHFLAENFNLFYFDFRFFGESQGKKTTFGFDERLDVNAAMAYLKKRPELDQERIGQYGFSLSAATFIQTHHDDVRAMVLDAPFLSLDAMLRDHYRFFIGPLKWPFVWVTKLYTRIFIKRDINQASALREVGKLTQPVLFIHGKKDRQIPVKHSEILFEHCPSSEKELWLVEEADHGETMTINQKQYQEKVRDFFLKYLNMEAL